MKRLNKKAKNPNCLLERSDLLCGGILQEWDGKIDS
jgi:hypothetical protein